MNKKYLQWMLMILVIGTVVALVWNHYGMNSVLVINADSPFEMRAIDDHDAGGNSESVLRRENGKLVLDCVIRTAFQWPFCEISIELGKPPFGMDLTRYDTVRLWAHSEGPAKRNQIRFFIRNFNAAYSTIKDPLSLKPQEVAYDPDQQAQPLEVNLSQFTVASWWSNARNMPMKYAGNEVSNVMVLGVSSGGYVEPGTHKITLERMEFQGKLIRPAIFRLGIIGIWLLAVIAYLIVDSVVTRARLAKSTLQQLSLARMNEGLRVQSKTFERLARRDPLTGALNRKGLSDQLLRLANKQKSMFPLSLVFIDIDNFKQINDRHGHSVGDEVLKQLAGVVKENIQRGDLFARWGGEEFLVVCPQTQANEAHGIADRLRQFIEHREWPEGMRVTSSFGISEWMAGEDITASIKRADEAMYRAKQEGRNRVEVQTVVHQTETVAE